MQRRQFMGLVLGGGAMLALPGLAAARPELELERSPDIAELVLDDDEWRARLSAEQYRVLREEGTERSGSSALNKESRDGEYRCAGCDLALFTSRTKFESGTGWPEFLRSYRRASVDQDGLRAGVAAYRISLRTLRRASGHVFEDGPRPTGLRWCNNGVALRFVPA